MKNIKILPAITTTPRSFWREKIREIDKLGLEEVGLFPTMLSSQQREEMYAMLRNTNLKRIPFVHLRTGMLDDEVQMLMDDFGTNVFNVHSKKEHPISCDLKKFGQKIYVENHYDFTDEELLNECSGFCLDVAHHENSRKLMPKIFKYFSDQFKKNKIGCGHISGIKKTIMYDYDKVIGHYDAHYFDELYEFEYLLKYKDLLPPIMAMEVENSLEEQLKAINYIHLFI